MKGSEFISGKNFASGGNCEIVTENNWLSFTTINKNNIYIKSKVNTQTIVNDKVFAHVVFSFLILPLLLTIGSVRARQWLLR